MDDNKLDKTSTSAPKALPIIIKTLGFILLVGSVTLVSCASALKSIV